MNKYAVLLTMIWTLSASESVFAQNLFPRAEFFGGFSYLPADGDDFPRKNSYGYQFSIGGNLNRWFGVVADFGGQYRKVSDLGPGFPGITAETSVYEYLVGPRFSVRRKEYTLFFHALAGGAKGNSGLDGFSDSAFALGAGGGLDINIGSRMAVRAIQLDYLGSFVDILESNARLGFGIVLKFGQDGN